ncbi:MAG: DUF4390 domain-containing protein [Steroidobacteraceae bacterium]
MRFVRNVMALLLPLLAAGAAHASESFKVQSAFLNLHDAVYELDARIIYPLNDDVRSALAHGATVKFALQAVIEKRRRYWLDATVVEATLRRELTWNAVSQRYILRDVGRGTQESFVALDEALAVVGVVNRWPVLMERALDPDARYEIRIRAGYRSSRLPDALRALAFWSDGWVSKSEWKSWILPR